LEAGVEATGVLVKGASGVVVGYADEVEFCLETETEADGVADADTVSKVEM
jgi:hypothetical protein